jgi:hypothetical protein
VVVGLAGIPKARCRFYSLREQLTRR